MTFFVEQATENIAKADAILNVLKLHETLGYLFFLDFALDELNKFNATFQSRETLTQDLYPASKKLLLWFLDNFIQPSVLKLGDLDTIDLFDKTNYRSEIKVGSECASYLREQLSIGKLSESAISSFKENCLQFYLTASTRIHNDLPIKNSTLKSIALFKRETALFEPDRHSTFHSLMKLCQKLQLTDSKWLNSLLKEWEMLYQIDENGKKSLENMPFDEMWTKISFIHDASKEIAFPKLCFLSTYIRTVPHSNAEAERAFSIIPEAKAIKRNCLGNDTVSSICVLRFNLKSTKQTALTMPITRKHLEIMSSDVLYSTAENSIRSAGQFFSIWPANENN